MWVKMTHNIAGPEGAALAGEYAEVSDPFGEQLVSQGYATAVAPADLERLLGDRKSVKTHFQDVDA